MTKVKLLTLFDFFVLQAEKPQNAERSDIRFWSVEKNAWVNLICATVFLAEYLLFERLPTDVRCYWLPLAHAYDSSLVELTDVYELLEKDIETFEALEIQGVRQESDDTVVCDNEAPQWFSVFATLNDGGTCCLGDFGLYGKALDYARLLSKKHGLAVSDLFSAEHHAGRH